MKNEFRSKPNPKIIALIIEVALLVAGSIFVSIWYGMGKTLEIIPVMIISLSLLGALVFTLILIRYDSIRALRKEGYYGNKEENKIFLNIYTDSTTLMGHDLKDESEERRKK